MSEIYPLLHVAQSVKHLPAMRETWFQFLGQEDPLEKERATHSSILAAVFLPGESHGQRSLAGCSTWITRVGHGLALSFFVFSGKNK